MSGTTTGTGTYTGVDVENVMRRVKADMIMIADSTGAWTPAQAADYAYDIEILAKNGYLAWADVALFSGATEIRAVRFKVDAESGSLSNERPGGVRWPKVASARLRILISHTSNYDDAAAQAMSGKLKGSWVSTSEDASHSSLTSGGGRSYASGSYGMDRKDWSE